MRQIGNQIDYAEFCKSFKLVSPNRFVRPLPRVLKTEVIAFICDFIACGNYQSSERPDCFAHKRAEYASCLCASSITENDLFFRGFVTQLELFP